MRFLKFLARDKKSIISLSLLYISVIIFVAYMFSKVYIENIPIGIVDMDNSSLSRTIIDQLRKSPGVNISYYTDSQEELQQEIKEKRISGGIVIPKNFNKDAVKKKSPSIALLIDETNIVTGNNLYAYSNAVIATVNAGIQLKVFEGKNMMPYNADKAITTFLYSERTLYEPQLSYMRYLMYSLVPYLLQGIFLMTFLVPALIKNRKQLNLINLKSKDGIKNILLLLVRILMIIAIAVFSSLVALCILGKYSNLPLRGNILEYLALTSIFVVDLTAVGFLFAALFNNLIYFTQFFTMINILIFLTSGVPFPEYAMPDGLPKIIRSIWPFMNIALPLKFLNLKGSGWDIILPYIKDGIVYALEWFLIGIVLYSLRIAISKYKNKRISRKENEMSEENEKSVGAIAE
ncbi:MAG: ABC transporter permease [Clostridium sp.]|uniref:ABC transporter permease n=1 Tax=Clostridium sp. TaxID=1506 RepID=UPI0025BA869B|nr:ABC transporter permease [Clostridium sp.]MCE5220262.1 ABC transporter permease [Clostridium sp.]